MIQIYISSSIILGSCNCEIISFYKIKVSDEFLNFGKHINLLKFENHVIDKFDRQYVYIWIILYLIFVSLSEGCGLKVKPPWKVV